MLIFIPMKKSEAIDIFGGTQKQLAEYLGLTPSAISQWPDELDQATSDRLLGAALRFGLKVPVHLLAVMSPPTAP